MADVGAALREEVRSRAKGRCEYCLIPETLALASIDLETGELHRLFHPRRDRWRDHFQLRGGAIVALTAIGRVTLRLLQLNRSERVKERELAIQAGMISG